MGRTTAAWSLVVLLCAAGGCAQSYPPPGGQIDPVPPMIVSTSPEHLSIVPPGTEPLVIRFDKRISERGVDGLVSVSPETGRLRVKRGRSELRVSLEGGWRPDQVYRVVLNPGLRDLFGNERRLPAEIVFSTGPPIQETALAGVVLDRITGRPFPPSTVRVEALRLADSTMYVAEADGEGLFAMRYLPPGRYGLAIYADRNRNRRLDPPEAFARDVAEVAPGDTTLIAVELLARDSTAAVLARAEARDSLQIVLSFDDYMDPTVAQSAAAVRLWRLPDSVAVAVDTVLFPHEHRDLLARRTAETTTDADSAGVARDTETGRGVAPGAPGRDGAGQGGTRAQRDTVPATPRPVRELIVVPATPLEPGTAYVVEVEGVVNLWGLAGGGGSVRFETRERLPSIARPADGADAAAGADGADAGAGAPDSAGDARGAPGPPSGTGPGADPP